ncbi:transferrin-binding protein-like solute binding protein [Novosphingobium flavum]|uniref:Transferrin-binding protein-like solute binding protein n=2 Tax=Novosphingobium flavum TaxID=1778672 RepID=A0A7X1FUT8_9SPHN|nr:transferrin-binding protein-like solute binding protein [Novosphingobium flavum]
MALAISGGLAALLGGCGGGGGAVASAPAPASALPAPPFPMTQNASYAATTARSGYRGHVGDGIFTSSTAVIDEAGATGRTSANTFAYNAVSGTYTVTDQSGSASFTAADRVTATGYADKYVLQSAGRTDTLTAYGNLRSGIAGTPPITLTYSSFAQWDTVQTSPETTRTAYFTFGEPTGTAMPHTGTASYATTVRATALSGTYAPVTMQGVTGLATFSADFAAGSVATTLQLSWPNATYNGAGTINADHFDGTFTSNSPTFGSGSFFGSFYGPNAAEVGYSFMIAHVNPDPYAGASIAPGQIYLTGIVAGAKN